MVEKVRKHYKGEVHINIQEMERTQLLPGSMRPGKRRQKFRADYLQEAWEK